MKSFLLCVRAIVGGIVLLALSLPSAAAAESRPNVIIILADDLGYGDLGAYNPDSKIATPHLDRLVAGGSRFTDAHTPSSVCTPTRYGLLTGRYSWRTRLKNGVLDGFSPPLIEAERPTIASFLRDQGYRTACFGKWHLGMQWTRQDGTPESLDRSKTQTGFRGGEDIDFSRPLRGGPTGVGFDYYYGISASLDMPPYCWIENDRALLGDPTISADTKEMFISGGRGVAARDFKLDQVLPTLKAKTVGWIASQLQTKSAAPFFIYVPLNSPHLPVVPSAAFVGKSGSGLYGDFVMETDDFVGAVVEALRAGRALENTLILFTSDNGGLFHAWTPVEADDVKGYRPTPRGEYTRKFGHQSNGPLRGTKADIHEGGHRVPFIVHWPRGVKAGMAPTVPVELTDIFATVAEAVGGTLPAAAAPDSFSFLGEITKGTKVPSRRPHLVHHSIKGVFAVREGKWKFVEGRGSAGFSTPQTVKAGPGEAVGELYDMEADWRETKNVYLNNPERVAHFERLLAQIKAGTALRVEK